MKRLSATSAALTAAAITVAVALPAAASTGAPNGGVAASSGGTSADSTQTQARTADYRPVKATWYGPGFFGNETACGEKLTRTTIGVAHRTLPCGTRVVLNYNGLYLRTTVIDRGPFAHRAKWDLTQAAAQELGFEVTDRIRVARLDAKRR